MASSTPSSCAPTPSGRDGTPVTAQNFVFAFQRLFDPATASDYAYLQYPIKNSSEIAAGAITDFSQLGVKAIDDKTLEITLEGPTPFFLQALTHYTAYPVPQGHASRSSATTGPRSRTSSRNGPYTLVEWVPGRYLTSVKSETYYGKDNVRSTKSTGTTPRT